MTAAAERLVCWAPGCEKLARRPKCGLCTMHEQRLNVHGSLDDPRPTLRERLMRHVEVSESGCWLWTSACNRQGYGHVRVAGRMMGAHRASYQEFVGPVPAGLQLDHTCHDPAECSGGPTCMHRRCINPAHLEPVTPQENSRRAEPAMRTHCPRGHEYTPENTRVWGGKRKCLACQRRHQANYLTRQEVAS